MIAPTIDLTAAAKLLDESDAYRVLRRFVPRRRYAAHRDDVVLHRGLYVDVETTGTDTDRDQIIELAILPFRFDDNGVVYDVGAGYEGLQYPGGPIPSNIVELTGITDEMVFGECIDWPGVVTLLGNASVVIAHKAEFDRRMTERAHAQFSEIDWACSYTEVPWQKFGCVGGKLQHILADTCSEFYDAHRALDDCRVGLHVLASAQLDGRTALSYLLESSRQPSSRVWAIGAPFHAKDLLKQRGYKWSDGSRGPKAWHRDVPIADVDVEGDWLRANTNVFRARIDQITARDRYSVRAGV